MTTALRAMSAHNNLHAVLFNANSAEYIALTAQLYQLARYALIQRLDEGTYRNPAVVLDLDETVLDNSAFQAWLIASGCNYHEPTNWSEWCRAGEAEAIPGAVEFVLFAMQREVTPIFITSRPNATREGTARNLVRLGLLSEDEFEQELIAGATPENAYSTRLFMKAMPGFSVDRPGGAEEYSLGNKFLQRVFCEQERNFEIILSVGDNLADYAEYYGAVLDENGVAEKGSHPSPDLRCRYALQDLQLFGRDFILIPNASYGGWLRAYEANGIGASDELVFAGTPVRGGLMEPQEPIQLADGAVVTAKGPKLAKVRVWKGPP